MEKNLKKILPFIYVYIVAVVVGIGLLFIVSKIPQSYLTENWKENRNTNITSNIFHLIKNNDYSTFIDDYTENLKIDLAYRLNEQSILNPTAYMENTNSKYEYGRYWHGYCIILRPLLLFFNLSQIRIIAGSSIVFVYFALIFQLWKKKQYSMIFALLTTSFVNSFWITTQCIQYFNCSFISLLASIFILKRPVLYKKYYLIYFFIIGIIVNFFDLLTFETLTLTLPLIFGHLLEEEKLNIFSKIKKIFNSLLIWITGYSSMFLTKWLLYFFVKGAEVKEEIINKIIERSAGINNSSKFTIEETLKLNIANLKGFTYNNWILIFILFFIIFAICSYLFNQMNNFNIYIIFLIIGCIPFIRFIFIREHSASHFYFTYYALLPFVIAMIYPFINGITNIIKKEKIK